MSFHDRKTFSPQETGMHIPGKVYVHSEGFEKVYQGKTGDAYHYFVRTLAPVINANFSTVLPFDSQLYLAILWGNIDNKTRRADVFFMRGLKKDWSANPSIYAAQFAESWYLNKGPITCGEGAMVLGAEERLRRRSPDLATYLKEVVPLNEIS